MNLVTINVSNITEDRETKYPNVREIVADIDCYGRKEYQKTITLHLLEYNMVMEKGYYLG